MTRLRHGLAVALAAGLLVAIVWASTAPMTAHPSPDAVLRLAWGARPERIERCRQLSDEELAGLPQHMRQTMDCEGVTATYRLQVRVNGALVAERVVHGGGLRRDRRLFVFEELALPPGEAAVDVSFNRVEPDAEPAAGKDEDRGEIPPRLSVARRIRLLPRQVVLVTYEANRRELEMVGASDDRAIGDPMAR